MLWATLTDEEKRYFFRQLVDRAIVKEGIVVEVRLKV
jgi:hypothetical protein